MGAAIARSVQGVDGVCQSSTCNLKTSNPQILKTTKKKIEKQHQPSASVVTTATPLESTIPRESPNERRRKKSQRQIQKKQRKINEKQNKTKTPKKNQRTSESKAIKTPASIQHGDSRSSISSITSSNSSSTSDDAIISLFPRRDGKHLMPLLRDQHHVLELRRPPPVPRLHRPPI